MGSGCSSPASTAAAAPAAAAPAQPPPLSNKAVHAVAEFFDEETPKVTAKPAVPAFGQAAQSYPYNTLPEYPDGSREATLVKCFRLIDSNNSGYLEVTEWKEYMLRAGVPEEEVVGEVTVVLKKMDKNKDHRISADEFVAAMMKVVLGWDDRRFGELLAETLNIIKGKSSQQENLVTAITKQQQLETLGEGDEEEGGAEGEGAQDDEDAQRQQQQRQARQSDTQVEPVGSPAAQHKVKGKADYEAEGEPEPNDIEEMALKSVTM